MTGAGRALTLAGSERTGWRGGIGDLLLNGR